MAADAVSFRSGAAFRRWLAAHHAKAPELLIRLFKVHALDQGMGYRDALDEALCFGWIDAVRRGLDGDSFLIRFTPRKAKSYWSDVNLRRAKELEAEGRMHAAGRAAWQATDLARAPKYSFESEHAVLEPAMEKRFRASRGAWKFFEAQPPGYRRLALFRVMRAKQAATRERNLDKLIASSAAGLRLDAPQPKRPKAP
jgi:uncharacterized protein YdeI (YjbR/CyaY-like superfamily)